MLVAINGYLTFELEPPLFIERDVERFALLVAITTLPQHYDDEDCEGAWACTSARNDAEFGPYSDDDPHRQASPRTRTGSRRTPAPARGTLSVVVAASSRLAAPRRPARRLRREGSALQSTIYAMVRIYAL